MMKEKDKRYIKLYSTCFAVKGFRRSIIVDTQREQYFFIPNSLYHILTSELHFSISEIYCKYSQEDQTLDEYIQFLIEKELAFFTNEPENFPAIDLTWESPKLITNAIVDIASFSSYNLLKAIKEIDELGSEIIQIRIYDIVNTDWLLTTLSVITNETRRTRSIEIFLKYDSLINDYENLEEELAKFNLLGLVVFHSSKLNINKSKNGLQIIYIENAIDNESHCGNIHSYYFSLNIDHFLEAQNYNTCLNKKISIDSNGFIKNCPSMKQSFGHVDSTSLKEVLNIPQFQRLWGINKSSINTCKDCEFRFICSDCRAYLNNDLVEKPIKCNYDPYSAKWVL